MALVSSSAVFPDLKGSALSRHVLVMISEERACAPAQEASRMLLRPGSSPPAPGSFGQSRSQGFPSLHPRPLESGQGEIDATMCLRDLQLYSENHFILGTFLLSVHRSALPKELPQKYEMIRTIFRFKFVFIFAVASFHSTGLHPGVCSEHMPVSVPHSTALPMAVLPGADE